MSRRALLRRGGALALATGVATLAPYDRVLSMERFDRLSDFRLRRGGMRKCISLGGPGPLRTPNDPDDYRLWGNRELFRESGTRWVKLWVSWFDLQQELESEPASLAESWDHLNRAPDGGRWLRRLDRQVRAAKQDGLGVIVTVFHTFPTWSNGASGNDPADDRKPPEQRLPRDLSADGPWAWFIAHLCARYTRGAPPNPIGPHRRPRSGEANGYEPGVGNPSGGWIDVLEICNEPNLLYWPQERVPEAVVRMVRSAEQVSHAVDGPAIMAPATSDFPDQNQEKPSGLIARGWESFTEEVHEELRDLRPRVPLLWSHHNFNDVKRREDPSRTERVLEVLRSGWTTQIRPLWLTEGGYNMHPREDEREEQREQARLIERDFERARRTGGVYMWTQHTISDKAGNDFKSGLRGDFVAGKGPGEPRPSWRLWRRLPGSTVR